MNKINKRIGMSFLIMTLILYVCGSCIYTKREIESETVSHLSDDQASKVVKNIDLNKSYRKFVYITELETKTMIPFVYKTKQTSRVVKYKD
jgi:hypothetical protein